MSIDTQESQTWTAPEGVAEVSVTAWGSGASGGVSNSGAGGGGGGAYASKTVSVSPGQVYFLQVGADGGPSGFRLDSEPDTWIVYAVGGSTGDGRLGGKGGDKTLCIGDVVHSGGFGGSSDFGFKTGGGGGASGGSVQDGNGGLPAHRDHGGDGGIAVLDGDVGGRGEITVKMVNQ